MRVAYIDMRNTSHQCPSGLTLFSRSSPSRRVCNVTTIGCVGTTFTVHGVEYSQVYGRIIGYQNKVPIAFSHIMNTNYDEIYVYGVSLTHGQSLHKHIWMDTPTLWVSDIFVYQALHNQEGLETRLMI